MNNVHPAIASALRPFSPPSVGHHYRSARIAHGSRTPPGFRPGQLVGVRWSGTDRRGRDLFTISSTNSFTGYSPTFCAPLLNEFSTSEV